MAVLWLTPADTVDPTDPMAEVAVEAASFILYNLTGQKYGGIRTTTEVYSTNNFTSMAQQPVVISGQLYNIPRGQTASGLRNLRLRNQPVRSVEAVYIGNNLLDPAEYTLRNNSYLVRRNQLPWVLDPVNEIEVTYTHGTPPPALGKAAAIRLANELIWAEQGSDLCSLPEKITSVSRQGIDYTVLDPQEFLENGRTGIYTIDLFINAANPSKAKKKAKVFSPNHPRGERIN